MSLRGNLASEGRNVHGGYCSTFDGNNFNSGSRKRCRNNYDTRNYNLHNNDWAEFGVNFNNYNLDHTNYVNHDSVSSSFKRRKYSAPTWEDNHLANTVNVPYTISPNCNLDCSIFEDEEPIFMSRDQIDRHSPSRKDGIDLLHETHLRYSYCAFLQNLGMRLQLPQTTIGTAMVLCHRFFVRQSHAYHDRFLIATAALFLTGKSEETPRPLNDVLRSSSEILHKQDFTLLSYLLPVGWFEKFHDRVLEAEQTMLTTLNFELNVQHPYAPLTSILNKLGPSKTVLVNLALHLISEGNPAEILGIIFFLRCCFCYWLRSSLWLQFKPHHIAAGAAYLASKFLNMNLAAYDNIWQEFQATPSILRDVSQQLMELF